MTRILFFSFLLLSWLSIGQEQPPILRFTPEEYQGANQNWGVSQGEDEHIYIANNEGLLEFDGSSWQIYSSPNETIMRSVAAKDDRIYTGCYMEFGYWVKNELNNLVYTSLSSKVKDQLKEDEQFWKIIPYEDWIIFQSLDQIYVYNVKTESFNIITPENGIIYAYEVAGNIYYQSPGLGIYEIKNGKSRLLIDAPEINEERVVGMFSNEMGLVLVTESEGLYIFSNDVLKRWSIPVGDLIKNWSIYKAIQLSNGEIALGTISHGIILLSKEGVKKYHIDQNKGLGNNTVLSLYEDHKNHLWLGLDNGVDCLNFNSPIVTHYDGAGMLGTVYAATSYNDKLYVGTNQGLFYKGKNTDSYKLIEGTKGQVWSLYVYDDTLFCGHNIGTFIIKGDRADLISDVQGAWKYSQMPGKENMLLQGNYQGIYVLRKNESNNWQLSHKIEGFDYSSRYFEVRNDSEVIVSHEYKGVFLLTLDKSLKKFDKVERLSVPEKGKNAGLATFNRHIYYASKDGVFAAPTEGGEFSKDSLLSTLFENDTYCSGKLVIDETGKLWIFTTNNINYVSTGKLTTNPVINKIPIPLNLRNTINGFENVTHLSENNFLFGATNGYFIINTDKLSYQNYEVGIKGVYYNDERLARHSLPIEGETALEYKKNNINISFSVPEFEKFIIPEYQYKLGGFADYWSPWTTNTTIGFENLPFGTYTFFVRARIGNTLIDNVASYEFTINRPWYLSNAMIAVYLVVFIFSGFVIHRIYKVYYEKKEQKLIEENKKQLEIQNLENKQQLMELKNEKLRQDVESKNRELAASAMGLISKNEILSQIKQDLTKDGDLEKNVKSVIKTIKVNTREEDNWNIFKEAFNNADSDFLKKVKELHGELTPNDLRLCAYLRLNLSSKEIAPLLNISVRSVEIKRYRLRKKMDLPREKSLVEYILEI
ncbi:helix-turn-helix and ligand-binding sensor domain-containing protein [Zhouia amylolytica]|nr:two-component regulator propeller domain-containing protein [Zhouia amylolytica]ETN95850.1 putative transcriptional regulator [Zhouia amylolytica AD3]